MKHESKRTILIAGMGISPAVLTETVWALAHQKKPVVPDEIVVFTTTTGKECLKAAILCGKPSKWEEMKESLRKEKVKVDGKLVFTMNSVKVLLTGKREEMDDLRDGEGNLDAADFMLHELRSFTDEADTTVLCSIAGGRKTMSALLFSCMSLVGREQDRVYHVLIPPEYDGSNLDPVFYFPRKGRMHLLTRGNQKGKKVPAAKIGIELFEVPFVRMRGWYQEKFKAVPPTYKALVKRVQGIAPPAVVYPKLEIDVWNGSMAIDETTLKLSYNEMPVLILAAAGCPRKKMSDMLVAISTSDSPDGNPCEWLSDFQEKNRMGNAKTVKGVLSHVSNELREKLKKAGFANATSLIVSGNGLREFPDSHIKWLNREKFKRRCGDICGYLFSADANQAEV